MFSDHGCLSGVSSLLISPEIWALMKPAESWQSELEGKRMYYFEGILK